MADKIISSTLSKGTSSQVKSVWGVPLQSQDQAPSLSDVMSEQMATDLQEKEDKSELKKIVAHIRETEGTVEASESFADNEADVADEQCTDDLLIAQMLQLQFDQEYDEVLKREMNHVNGSSKLTISYSKYQRLPLPFWNDESDDDDGDPSVDDDTKRDVDSYETADKELGQIPRCGYKKIGGQIVTKHDREISERSNGRRMMEFPPGIETGDGAATNGPQIHVSNAVYNKIRNFSIKEGKRKKRVNDKIDKSTADQAFDPATRLILFKMINNSLIESVHGILSTGKEAVIVFADGGPGPDDAEIPMNIPKELAIKIFKTTLNEFKNRDKYIKDDYRFRDRFSKQNPRKVIHMWAEKEMHNLMKMSKFGIPVPEVILLKKHVLVMSFIGDDGRPAPKLKEANLSDADVELAYAQTVETMNRLYNEVHLVHADLSEYNILWHEGQCWFIDVSQAVEPNHPHGLEFLYRDCKNVSDFFTAKGVHQCPSPAALFTSITGLPIDETGSEAEILTQVSNYLKHEDLLSGSVNDDVDGSSAGSEHKVDSFDYCWNASKLPRTPAKPIPGHAKQKSGTSGAKSPRSPTSKSPRSPRSSFFGAKSPKTPPNSNSSLAGVSDDDLKSLKAEMVRQALESKLSEDGSSVLSLPRKESQVKFVLDEANASSSEK